MSVDRAMTSLKKRSSGLAKWAIQDETMLVLRLGEMNRKIARLKALVREFRPR